MNRRQILRGLLGAALAIAVSAASALAADLTVTVTYTGKGKVDAKHDILVFLFTTPNINAESVPMTVQSVPMSGGTATFKGLVQDPVYVVMVYNEKADYTGTDGPPPDGLPWRDPQHGRQAGSRVASEDAAGEDDVRRIEEVGTDAGTRLSRRSRGTCQAGL